MKNYRAFPLLVLFTALLFLGTNAFSQETDDEDWYLNKTITQIQFEGLTTIKKSELSGLASSYIGKTVESCIYELIDRLYALELFDDISPLATHDKGDGVIIVFTVKEKPVVTSITFKGNKQVRNAPLREAIHSKTNEIFSSAKALSDERAIRNVYLEKGFTDVHVSYKTEETEEGIAIIFVIREGHSSVITSIDFSGNTVFKTRVLKRQLKLKEVGIINKGAFQESMLENDRQAILKYYADHGYIDAQIIDVTRDVTYNEEKKRDEMHITFYMQEGNQYKFDGMTFNGNSIFSSQKLSERVTMKKGEIFNQTKFNECIMGITDLYYENGYTSNGFAPSINKDTVNKTVSFVLNIAERDRSHVESIIIRGNSKTKEYVITREIPLESGDVFSKTKLTTGLRNLYNLQYFSSVVPDIQAGSEGNLINIVINVEEQMTNSVEFGLTFSGVTDPTQLPFALFAKWANSNVFGTGRTMSASTTISSAEQSLALGYSQNWTFGLPIELSESLSVSHSNATSLRLKVLNDGTVNTKDYYMQYESWTTSLNSSIGRRWMWDWATFTLSGGLTNSLKSYIYDESIYTPLDPQICEYANKLGLVNSIWGKASLDGRDINYDPTRGWFVSQQLGWYGLTPWETDFYARFDTKLEGYWTLFSIPFTEKYTFRMIFAALTSLSLQYPAPGSSVSDSNKLYIDGMFNGRGWTNIYNTVKGRALWSNCVELRMPVVPGILAIDGFFDATAIKDTPENFFGGLTGNDFYFSFGPEIRVLLPQFPMKFMFCNTFKFTDDKFKWHDTMKFVLSFNFVNK
ncbi:outer membrane protein assembly factor BamA [Treponema sp.]|uniref:outer membrane protein assembly factor BamA n=1 Tax=Treponema sp. TaxID=166 RepID=UPI00298DC5C5|nr:outer membrane protein assembly factor BamA [Treponema sp.]MCR5612182.1 outer membrane protein assembly factor BamA [Treponema sp.]